jgi:hypothetical protein
MAVQDPSTKITLQVDKRTHHDLRTPLNQIIGYSDRAVQRYLLKVIENMDLRPPRAAA